MGGEFSQIVHGRSACGYGPCRGGAANRLLEHQPAHRAGGDQSSRRWDQRRSWVETHRGLVPLAAGFRAFRFKRGGSCVLLEVLSALAPAPPRRLEHQGRREVNRYRLVFVDRMIHPEIIAVPLARGVGPLLGRRTCPARSSPLKAMAGKASPKALRRLVFLANTPSRGVRGTLAPAHAARATTPGRRPRGQSRRTTKRLLVTAEKQNGGPRPSRAS